MGLLSSLEGKQFPSKVTAQEENQQNQDLKKEKENIGLLQKTLQLSANQKKSNIFSQNILFYALFQKKENHFYITNSFGLDYQSIFSSPSTVDFWEGSIKQRNNWNYFTQKDNTITQFYQFFSKNLKDKINEIAIFFNSDEKILMLGSESQIKIQSLSYAREVTDYFLKDKITDSNKDFAFPALEDSNIYKLKIDAEACVEKIISANLPDQEQSQFFYNSIYKEIFNRLNAFFTKPNTFIQKDKANGLAILFSKSEIKEEIIHKHLIYALKDFAEDFSQYINLTFFEKAETKAEILNFLQAE